MVTNALCRSFQRLRVGVNGTLLPRYSSTSATRVINSGVPLLLHRPTIDGGNKSIYEPNFRLSALRSTLDLDLPNRPGSIGEIGEFPMIPNLRIGEPPKIERRREDIAPEKSLDLPSSVIITEKQAARMIVIRRRKMRKHKLKKLRKRMKFHWGKIKQKREMAKEKAFHALLLGQIRRAEAWDPREFVKKRLAILDEVRIPNKFKGEILPEAQIREFMKKRDERLRKTYNKPRLTL